MAPPLLDPPPDAVPPGPPAPGGDLPSIDAWRGVLTRRFALLAFVVNAVATALSVALLEGHRAVEAASGGTVVAFGLGLALRESLPQRTRAWLIVLATVATAVTGYASRGFLGGSAAAVVLSVLVAALLLGPRATAWVVVGIGASVTAIGAAIVSGWLPPPTEEHASPLNALAWVRTVGVTLLSAGLGGAMVTWVVARIEASVARVRLEVSRRRAAEVARRDAEHVAVEAQKLELIGRLAAGLAHDFNNHLTVIAMAHGRLADPSLDADARRDTSRAIQDSVRSAGSLARQLLVLGRRAARTLVDVALADVVDGFLPSLERVLPSDVRLEVEHEGDVVVHADEMQLQQALLNFVVNARDAMPGGGRLIVRTRRVIVTAPQRVGHAAIEPGTWAQLEVEDDGTGIDPAVRDRVFEPFFTTKPLEEGSGLGLSTVAMMAAEAGGHVALDTEVGRGTRITLWLPASAARAREATPTSTPLPGAASLAGRVVLVVEDEPLLLEAAVRVLADAGCRVLPAADGTAALEVLAAHQEAIDLLCTDVVMPGTPVRDVIARFRELHPTSPVLTCSGYVGEDLVRRGIEEGRYRLLQKPYAADDLTDAVSALLRLKEAPRRVAG